MQPQGPQVLFLCTEPTQAPAPCPSPALGFLAAARGFMSPLPFLLLFVAPHHPTPSILPTSGIVILAMSKTAKVTVQQIDRYSVSNSCLKQAPVSHL